MTWQKKQSYAIQINTLAPYQQRKTLHNTENELLVNKLLRILHNSILFIVLWLSLTGEPLLKGEVQNSGLHTQSQSLITVKENLESRFGIPDMTGP